MRTTDPLATKPTWPDLIVRFVLVPLVAAIVVYGLVMYASTGAGGHKHPEPDHEVSHSS
ncbi:MAG: hypothetical protein IT229_00910 [Flavobacteriales bacterium]|nr:hypothetical protein [Flavobacteriales bacterium]